MVRADTDWVLATEQGGYSRHFDAVALPVSFGGEAGNDIALADVTGSIQIGVLDGVFFVQPGRGTTHARIDGERIAGSRRIADGSEIALDTARLRCRLHDGRLTVDIEAQITAGDTAPPDIEALTQERPDEMTVSPIAFRPESIRTDADRRRGPGKGALAVYAGFLVLATLGWFAFTAKSVRFEFEPAAANFDLPSTWFKFRLGDRWLLRVGAHRVAAELPGYYPIDEIVAVADVASQTVELEFVRLPGLIDFTTEPVTAAEVRLDGELIGTTPLEAFEVRPGTHQVQFTAERYLSELVTLEVEGGHARQTVSAALTPSWAPIAVSSNPPGADVRVDGRVLGQTPAELELTAGDREIELVLAGFNPVRRQIRVVADEPQTLPEIRLELADARLALDTEPADATINLNGEFLGRTPFDLRLRPNVRHELTLRKPGYATEIVAVELRPGQRETIDIALDPELGSLEISSEPPGAEVVIDGEAVGVTPLVVERMSVEHEIAIRLEGYAAQERRVTPRPGYPQSLDFELIELDEAGGSGYARTIETGFGQTLMLIPVQADPFTMGSSRAERDRRSNEALRPVTLSRAFYLATTEMTNAQFRMFCDTGHDSGTYEGRSLNGDDQPVVNVGIQDVFACLNQISIADGLQPVYQERNGVLVPVRPLRNGYRLATEAEFAWALRFAGRDGAEPLRFPWGPEARPPGDRIENVADLSAQGLLDLTLLTYTDGQAVSAPVASFAPNAAGLYDMGGNVAEWVQDFYDPLTTETAAVAVDPLGPESGSSNVIRGPGWQDALTMRLRLAYRDYDNARRADLGFRIARNLE